MRAPQVEIDHSFILRLDEELRGDRAVRRWGQREPLYAQESGSNSERVHRVNRGRRWGRWALEDGGQR